MQAQEHLKVSPILGLLYFTGGIESMAIAIVASILIDFDHLHLIIREKTYTVKKVIKLSQNIYDQDSIKRCFYDVTYSLHSIEVNILLIIIGYYFCTQLICIAIGFIFHIICDIIHHRKQKLPILSWLILTTYFIRLSRKNTSKKS